MDKKLKIALAQLNPLVGDVTGNVDKLILKYTELAREALSNGDKILSENYYQYADHFLRISIEQKEKQKDKLQTSLE